MNKKLPKIIFMGLSLTLLMYSCKKDMNTSTDYQENSLTEEALLGLDLDNIHMCTQPFEEDARAALVKNKKWKNGSEITVKLIGGTKKVNAKVESYSKQWSEYANITFKYVTEGDADIRVTFVKGNGSNSRIGTDALKIAQDKSTMNLGWLTDKTKESEISRVVLHEFGHALGLTHEHQHPYASIPWDKPKVYAYYEKSDGWDKKTVDANILKLRDSADLSYSKYDRKSIMHYYINKALLTDSTYALSSNKVLSATDKSFIAKMYPKE